MRAWAAAAVLWTGVLLCERGRVQSEMPLRGPLEDAVPARLGSHLGRDLGISEEERRVAGMTSYLYRQYLPAGAEAVPFTVYVGYYASQAHGRTIHSPRNCLPGAGWETLVADAATVRTPQGAVRVNRHLLQRDGERVLALYWYQGRGRVEANEYRVKWSLLRDAALRARTEEALVRIVVPIQNDRASLETAVEAAREIIPALATALPI